AAPAVYENRPTYRLIEADLAGAAGQAGLDGQAGPRLAFGRGRFFDGIDATGPAAPEYPAAECGVAPGHHPHRAALGGPARPPRQPLGDDGGERPDAAV